MTSYCRLMDGLYLLCMVVAGIALLIMVSVIPVGIFARYVLDGALSWPEPVAIVCMIILPFLAPRLACAPVRISVCQCSPIACLPRCNARRASSAIC